MIRSPTALTLLLLASVSAWQSSRIHQRSTKAGARNQSFTSNLYLDSNSDDVPRGPAFLGYLDSVASASINSGVAGHITPKRRENGAARSFGGYLDSLQQAKNKESSGEQPGFAYFCDNNVKATGTSDISQAARPKKAKTLASLDRNYLNSLSQEFAIEQGSCSFTDVDHFLKPAARLNAPVLSDTMENIRKNTFSFATHVIKNAAVLRKGANLVAPISVPVTHDQNAHAYKTIAAPESTKSTNNDLEPHASSLVVLNEAAVEFTAGVIGGMVGFAVAGPMGAVAAATVANYCSRQEDEISAVVQGISKTALEGYNHLMKLDAKHDFMLKAKLNVEGTLKNVKKSEVVSGKVIERVEKVLGSTVSKVAMISDETNFWGTTTSFFGFLGDLVEKSVHVAGGITKELHLVDHLFHGVKEVFESTKVTALDETKAMMANGMAMKGNTAKKADSTQSVKKALFGF